MSSLSALELIPDVPSARLAPWEENPYRLVSLWDILEHFNAKEAVRISEALTSLSVLYALRSTSLAQARQNRGHILAELRKALALTDKHGLKRTRDRIVPLRQNIASNPPENADYPDERLCGHLADVVQTMRNDLGDRCFVYLPPEDALFYELKKPFGEKAAAAFKSSVYDAEESAQCLALSRPTASVFHAMRALEPVLVAIAKHYGVRRNIYYFDQQQSVINSIVGKIKKAKEVASQNKTKKRLGTRLREQDATTENASLVVRLEACKDAWRNNVAHGRTKYTEGEARRIFEDVKHLMQDASMRFKERP